MTQPRYIVHESTGYRRQGAFAGERRTEVLVLDTAYCHRVVWSSCTSDMVVNKRYFNWDAKLGRKRWRDSIDHRTAFRWPLPKMRAYAADLAARLNAEDAVA